MALKVQTVCRVSVPKRAQVSALTLPIASERPTRPPAQKVNATWQDCEPPQGGWDGHMARRICQGGPGDTRLGAVLGDAQLSLGISSRWHLSDESRANGDCSPCLRSLPPFSISLFLHNLISYSLCFWQQRKAQTRHHAARKPYFWLPAHIILDWGEKSRSKKKDITFAAPSEEFDSPHVMWHLLFQNDW